jgi:hypothetical protein
MFDFSSWPRIIDIDLDAIDQLHALFRAVWICLGVNSASDAIKEMRPSIDFPGKESVVTLTLAPASLFPDPFQLM